MTIPDKSEQELAPKVLDGNMIVESQYTSSFGRKYERDRSTGRLVQRRCNLKARKSLPQPAELHEPKPLEANEPVRHYPEFRYQDRPHNFERGPDLSEHDASGDDVPANINPSVNRSQREIGVEYFDEAVRNQRPVEFEPMGPQQFIDNLQVSLRQLKEQVTEQNNKLHRYKRKIKKQSQEKADLSRDLQAVLERSTFPEREELTNSVRQLGG